MVLSKISLWFKFQVYIIRMYIDYFRRQLRRPGVKPSSTPQTIVILGASFAGCQVARALAQHLPSNTPHRLVLIDPNSHFTFTWALPRFCVIPGHEDKAFIPYERFLPETHRPLLKRIQATATEISPTSVTLNTGEVVEYTHLVIATGAGTSNTLPSRPDTHDKLGGVAGLRKKQKAIDEATNVVITGGGAAGVELAADAKERYPTKSIVLVHSREHLMSRFPPSLGAKALEVLKALGVTVILNDRMESRDESSQTITLKSGLVLPCDLHFPCTGQSPQTTFLSPTIPVLPSGRIPVLPSLQVAFPSSEDSPCDDAPWKSNIFACGDVAEGHLPNSNSMTANKQAAVVADNIAEMLNNKQPTVQYKPHWADGMIKLTLGLNKAVVFISNGKTDSMFSHKDSDETLHASRMWWFFGCGDMKDPEYDAQVSNQAK